MTSEPTVMTYSVSRGMPFSRPPRPMTTWRSVRSLMSTTRGQRIPCGSILQRVLVVQAVVDEGGGEVVRGTDRVDVTGQVEVEVLHRDDLAVAAAGRATLDSEDRAERRLADADRGFAADRVETLGEADGRGGLALAERRRGDRGDDDVFAARPFGFQPRDRFEGHLRLGRAVELELVIGDAEVVRDLDDRSRRTDRAISRSDGKLIGLLGGRRRVGWVGHLSVCTTGAPRTWCSAARIRWVSRIAFVSGPIPPGTGVIAEATSTARRNRHPRRGGRRRR